jgi:hypothetical protein
MIVAYSLLVQRKFVANWSVFFEVIGCNYDVLGLGRSRHDDRLVPHVCGPCVL